MRYPTPLRAGVLRARYKRFLAQVEVDGGEVLEVHVPNSGSMRGCSAPGSPCRISPAHGRHRRLPWTLEQVRDHGVWVGVNTARANGLALEALALGLLSLPGLGVPFTARREVRTPGGSRLDLCLEDAAGVFWVEVKNVTWVERGRALFPDAPTARGARHVEELTQLRQRGMRAGLVWVVQRSDARAVAAAAAVDPLYARALSQAAVAGVALAAIAVEVTPDQLTPTVPLEVVTP